MTPFRTIKRWFGGWLRGQVGASLVEYALLVALIAVVSLAAVAVTGQRLLDSYDCSATEFQNPGIRQAIEDKIKNGDTLDKLEERFATNCS